MKIIIENWENEVPVQFRNSINKKYGIKHYKTIKITPTLHFIDYLLAKNNFIANLRFKSLKNIKLDIYLYLLKNCVIIGDTQDLINRYIKIYEKTWLKGFEIEEKFLKLLPFDLLHKYIYFNQELDKNGVDFKIFDYHLNIYWNIQIKKSIDPWLLKKYKNIENLIVLKYIEKLDSFIKIN